MHNWFLSILVCKEVLTEEEAECLSKELATSIYSTRFSDAHSTVKKILKEYEKNR